MADPPAEKRRRFNQTSSFCSSSSSPPEHIPFHQSHHYSSQRQWSSQQPRFSNNKFDPRPRWTSQTNSRPQSSSQNRQFQDFDQISSLQPPPPPPLPPPQLSQFFNSRPSSSNSRPVNNPTPVVELDCDDDDARIEIPIECKLNETYTANTPIQFGLPFSVPWDKALSIARMEDGIVESEEDPENIFIVHSYSDNCRIVDMATCRCNCPSDRSPVCSHLAAVACRSPHFRLRLTLFAASQFKITELLKTKSRSQLKRRSNKGASSDVVRRVVDYIFSHYLPTCSGGRRTKTLKHRSRMISDGNISSDHDDDVLIEYEVSPNIEKHLLTGAIEAFVALLVRTLQRDSGTLPCINASLS